MVITSQLTAKQKSSGTIRVLSIMSPEFPTAKTVALISYHTCPLASEEGKETGGMNVYVLELAKALGKAGWQVDIYTRKQDPHNAAEVLIAERVTLHHVEAGPAANLSKLEMRSHIDAFTDQVWRIWQEQDKRYSVIHAPIYQD